MVNANQLWRSFNPNTPDVNAIRWEPVHHFGQNVHAELLGASWSSEELALYANLAETTSKSLPVVHRSLDRGQTWTPLPVE
jgi:hypothetical protein